MENAIRIPCEAKEKAVQDLRDMYQKEMGNMQGEMRTFRTREEYISTYRRELAFWESRTPQIDPRLRMPSTDEVARHAICTNARQNIVAHLKSYGISESEIKLAGDRS